MNITLAFVLKLKNSKSFFGVFCLTIIKENFKIRKAVNLIGVL
jgi:hypothetical protein